MDTMLGLILFFAVLHPFWALVSDRLVARRIRRY